MKGAVVGTVKEHSDGVNKVSNFLIFDFVFGTYCTNLVRETDYQFDNVWFHFIMVVTRLNFPESSSYFCFLYDQEEKSVLREVLDSSVIIWYEG